MLNRTVKEPRPLAELQRHGRTLYGELLKYSKVHPNPVKKQKYLKQIRADFRRYAAVQDPYKLEELIKKGTSRLGYIRMEIPAQLIPLKYRMQNLRNREKMDEMNKTTTTLSVDDDGKIAAGTLFIAYTHFSSYTNLHTTLNIRNINLDHQGKICELVRW